MNNPGAMEIVGVVKDALYRRACGRATARRERDAALRLHAVSSRATSSNEMTVYLRATTAAAADRMPERCRQAVRAARTRRCPVFGMKTMDQTVDEALSIERMLALLSASFGLLATVLAAVGLYGVMCYTVSRRTREIGIRIALGAERAPSLWLVLREVALLTAIGIAVGLPGALGLSHCVQVAALRAFAARSAVACGRRTALAPSACWPATFRPGAPRRAAAAGAALPSDGRRRRSTVEPRFARTQPLGACVAPSPAAAERRSTNREQRCSCCRVAVPALRCACVPLPCRSRRRPPRPGRGIPLDVATRRAAHHQRPALRPVAHGSRAADGAARGHDDVAVRSGDASAPLVIDFATGPRAT